MKKVGIDLFHYLKKEIYMKLRKSFISNSSSTSFIIDNINELKNKDVIKHIIDILYITIHYIHHS